MPNPCRLQCLPAVRRVLAPVLVLLAVAGLSLPAAAQSLDAYPEDLVFSVVNATTGEPGRCDRLTIDYMAARANTLIDIRPEGPEFTVRSVPLKDGGEYVVTAWSHDVPYFFSRRGRALKEGPITLHVFDVTDSVEEVAISGLNVVAQHQETILRLEYLLQVDNRTSPQHTVAGQPTFTFLVPPDAEDILAEYYRGPVPTPIPFTVTAAGELELTVPLTWGPNKIRFTATSVWTEGVELKIRSNLPVERWSLMTAPQWVQVVGLGLEQGQDGQFSGFGQNVGPALEAGQEFAIQLFGGEHITGPEGEIFSAGADSALPGADAAAAGGGSGRPRDVGMRLGVRLLIILLAVLMLIILLARRRR